MRIGVVTSAYHPDVGGVETHTRRLCTGLAAGGDEVEVLTQHARAVEERIDGVLVRRFPLSLGRPDYRFSVALWRWLSGHAHGYDVLHAHSYHALAALPAAVTNRTPLVFTPHYHGTGHSRLRAALHPIYRPVGRRIVDRAGRIVCVTRAERDLLLRDFRDAAGRIVVIPNGTDPLCHATTGGPGGIIVCVGRLERYKRVDRVIRAMTRLPGHRLEVVGAGPARADCERLAAELGLGDDRVRFHGRLAADAFTDLMATAAAAVSASAHEAFGMAVADALAAGIPTVASDLPAHRELAAMAGDGVWLVSPEDEPALADALRAAAAADRPAAPARLPTWADVVLATREVYAGIVPRLVGSSDR